MKFSIPVNSKPGPTRRLRREGITLPADTLAELNRRAAELNVTPLE